MYSLDCTYFDAEFKTLQELIDHCIIVGADPNYQITRNGVPTGELLIDFIQF
jgi:hypothetical protein